MPHVKRTVSAGKVIETKKMFTGKIKTAEKAAALVRSSEKETESSKEEVLNFLNSNRIF